MQATTKARLKLVAVGLLFLGPLIAAWLIYIAFPGQAPSGRTHHGELNDPARPLSDMGLSPLAGPTQAPVFDERWTVLQVAGKGCPEACRESLDLTRQVRALLHRRATRVQRVLVADRQPALEQHPDLAVYRGDGTLRRRLAEYPQGSVFLIDPLGNWVLTYPAPVDAEGLFKDIKHLLKLSNIG